MDHVIVTNREVGTYLDVISEDIRVGRQLGHTVTEEWPIEHDLRLVAHPTVVASHTRGQHFETVHDLEEGIALVRGDNGVAHVTAAGGTNEHALFVLDAMRRVCPRDAHTNFDTLPITFWTYGPHGAKSIRRDLDTAHWGDIAGNYTVPTRKALGHLMSDDFRPGVGGQLVLWNGDPGTGKTTALRALAHEHRDWLDMHYVVDPDNFFGSHADYMMDVFMGETFGPDEGTRWRILVLEDCGELLQPDARNEVGQALSRLLNSCDGLIGRGLRFLVLVTTNEPVKTLHEAVARPGRCAARIEFARFSSREANEWLREHDTDPNTVVNLSSPTLADLYGMTEGFRQRTHERLVGFHS